MLSPRLFASTPFRSPTALLDMAGTIELYLRGLVEQAGLKVALLPLGTPGRQTWLDGLQQQFQAVGHALGVPTSDIASFDLGEPADWASWTFAVATQLEVFRVAAGIA